MIYNLNNKGSDMEIFLDLISDMARNMTSPILKNIILLPINIILMIITNLIKIIKDLNLEWININL
jgi:hypothetical protein